MIDPQVFASRFLEAMTSTQFGPALRDASMTGNLRSWTRTLTAAVVGVCEVAGCACAAKGHRAHFQPVARDEYLNIDVTAYEARDRGMWSFPAAVIELENSRQVNPVCYSLWKLLCVRADLRVLFCYRERSEDLPGLIGQLQRDVVNALPLADRATLRGETVVVGGCRGDSDTFPHGFFRWWKLDPGTGRFDRM